MKKYILMSLSLGIAYLISQYSVNNIFIPQSPILNPNYIASLESDISDTKTKLISLLNPFNKTKSISDEVAAIPANMFKPISTGVAAYEKGDNTILDIKKGTKYKLKKIRLSNGDVIQVIDLTGYNP